MVITYQVATDPAHRPDWGVTDAFFHASPSLLFLRSRTWELTPAFSAHAVWFTAVRPYTGPVGPVPIGRRGPRGMDTLRGLALPVAFGPERPVAALHPIRTAAGWPSYPSLPPGQALVGTLLLLAAGGAMARWLAKRSPRPVVPAAGPRQTALAELADLERSLRAEAPAADVFADRLFRILSDCLNAEPQPVAPAENASNAERAAAVLARLEQMRFSKTAAGVRGQIRLLREVQEAIGPVNPSGAPHPLAR